jgi:hypothetical protein
MLAPQPFISLIFVVGMKLDEDLFREVIVVVVHCNMLLFWVVTTAAFRDESFLLGRGRWWKLDWLLFGKEGIPPFPVVSWLAET